MPSHRSSTASGQLSVAETSRQKSINEKSPDAPQQHTGRVCDWFKRGGFGFIRPAGDGSDGKESDVFVHYSDIQQGDKGFKSLVVGQEVEFIIGTDPRDAERIVATKVTGPKGADCKAQTRKPSNRNNPPQFKFCKNKKYSKSWTVLQRLRTAGKATGEKQHTAEEAAKLFNKLPRRLLNGCVVKFLEEHHAGHIKPRKHEGPSDVSNLIWQPASDNTDFAQKGELHELDEDEQEEIRAMCEQRAFELAQEFADNLD